jgi:hypothetical protein
MSRFEDKHHTLKAIQLDSDEPAGGELLAACEHIVRELLDGVHHGFSKMNISVEKGQSNKISITVEAGKSFRFIV